MDQTHFADDATIATLERQARRIADLEALCRDAAVGLSRLRTAIDGGDEKEVEDELLCSAMTQARLEVC